MNIGFIILCRFNSSRLPGKILRDIGGEPLLGVLLKRLEPLSYQNVIVATSVAETDNVIADYCRIKQIKCYRGSLENVAERFLNCALHFNLDYAVRINGDNLFADASLIKQLSDQAVHDDFDFVSNVPGRTYATGMSIEVVRATLYRHAYELFKHDQHYCEHVTLFLYDHPEHAGRHLYILNQDFPEAIGAKMAIDTLEDLEDAEKIISLLGNRRNQASWKEIITLKRKLNEQLEG